MNKEDLYTECNQLYSNIRYREDILINEDRDSCLKDLKNETYIEIPFIEFIITSKCNLKCKGCSNLIPLYKEIYEIDLKNYISQLDLLMKAIDFLYFLKIHGGEPLLSKSIIEILDYTEKYKNKIGNIVIPTNGSYIPSRKVLKKIKELNSEIIISQYEINSEKTKELIDVLKKMNINYRLMKIKKWYDLGEIQYYGLKDNTSKCLMSRFWSYMDSTIYLCSRAANGNKLGIMPIEDSEKIVLNGIDDKRKIFAFIEKNYFNYCLYCKGAFERTIKSGFQGE